MLLGDMCPECPCHEIINLLPRFIRQISCCGILLKNKLGPHYKMDDSRIYAIRSVVPYDLVVVLKLEGYSARFHRSSPPKPVGKNEVGDTAVALFEMENKSLVASELRWDTPELLEMVCLDNLTNLVPGRDVIFLVECGENALVFLIGVMEKFGAFISSLVLGNIIVPEGESGCTTHRLLDLLESRGET